MNKMPRRYQEAEHKSQQISDGKLAQDLPHVLTANNEGISIDKHFSQGQNVREQNLESPKFECLLNQDFVFDDGSYDLKYFSQKTWLNAIFCLQIRITFDG